MTVTWSAGMGSTQDSYLVAYRDTADSNAGLMGNYTTTSPTTSQSLTLAYGHSYEIWVWAHSGGVYSEPATTTGNIRK